jgi:hypothetical protein
MVYIRDLESKVCRVRLSNLTGTQLLDITQPEKQGMSIGMNIGGLESGLYLVEVTAIDGQIYTEKLIIK